jgi:hypothetical protein
MVVSKVVYYDASRHLIYDVVLSTTPRPYFFAFFGGGGNISVGAPERCWKAFVLGVIGLIGMPPYGVFGVSGIATISHFSSLPLPFSTYESWSATLSDGAKSIEYMDMMMWIPNIALGFN